MQLSPDLSPSITSSSLGCSLAYWKHGAGPRVLFIQGTGLHGFGWRPQLEDLSVDHECLWFDNRGIGQSLPKGSAAITVEQMANDVDTVLEAARWPDAHIVGHSLGGCIALQFALAYPEKVRSLSLLCTSADGPALVRLDAAMMWRGLRMQIGTQKSRRRAFLEIILTQHEYATNDLDQLALDLEVLFGRDLGVTPTIVMKQVSAMRKWNVMDRLAELNMPSLVVSAAEDLIASPKLVAATAAGIQDAHLEALPDAAHGVTVSSPHVVNELLRRHIADAR
ncbi:MAG: alpha/beta hydrolase [Deltaproteobacteria bacterium]|nr:alpha/beta hydrolase [Deltaproteobacteria bacterium]